MSGGRQTSGEPGGRSISPPSPEGRVSELEEMDHHATSPFPLKELRFDTVGGWEGGL